MDKNVTLSKLAKLDKSMIPLRFSDQMLSMIEQTNFAIFSDKK